MRSGSFIFRIVGLLFMMSLCQCTTSKYNLIDYKYYSNDDLIEQATYHYNNGALSFSTLTWFSYNDSLSISHVSSTHYYTAIHESEIDSIEISYCTTLPGVRYDTIKVVKTFDSNGGKKKVEEYSRRYGVWQPTNIELYDSVGNLRYEWYNGNSSWYSYDSLNRYLGRRREFNTLDSLNQVVIDVVVDTVIYIDDRHHVIRSNFRPVIGDSVQEIRPQEIYVLNKKGLIKSCQRGSLNNNGTSRRVIKEIYRYDLKARLKSKTIYLSNADRTKLKKNIKTSYQYLLGLKTKEKYVDFKKRTSNYVIKYKYDFRHRLLLEEKSLNSNGAVKSQKVWTYSKAE